MADDHFVVWQFQLFEYPKINLFSHVHTTVLIRSNIAYHIYAPFQLEEKLRSAGKNREEKQRELEEKKRLREEKRKRTLERVSTGYTA